MLLGQTFYFTFTIHDPQTADADPATTLIEAIVLKNGALKGSVILEGSLDSPVFGTYTGSFVCSAANGWAVGDVPGVLVEVVLSDGTIGLHPIYGEVIQDDALEVFLRRWTQNAGTKETVAGVTTYTILDDAGVDPYCHWTVDADGNRSAIVFD